MPKKISLSNMGHYKLPSEQLETHRKVSFDTICNELLPLVSVLGHKSSTTLKGLYMIKRNLYIYNIKNFFLFQCETLQVDHLARGVCMFGPISL